MHQLLGFNNPDPTPGKAEYGYEVWLTVGEGVEPEGEIKVKDFPGGLYAVTSCVGIGNIPKTWQQFAEWCKASKYEFGRHQWFEMHLTIPGTTTQEDMEFNLYLPIFE